MGVGGSSPSAPTNSRIEHLLTEWGTSVLRVRKLCERPGCAAPADVSYGIDKVALTVWVDNRAISEREHAGRLCRRHANALVVPRGWTLDDRREVIPRLFKALAEEVAAQGDTTKVRARKASATARKPKASRSNEVQPSDAPTLFESPVETQVHTDAIPEREVPADGVSDVRPLIDADETQAIPWSPRLTPSVVDDDSDDEAPVFGRLLGRAFGQKKSNESDES